MEGRLRGTHLRRDDRFVLDGEHLAELERGASHAAERHREPFRVRLRHEHRVAGEDGFDGCGGGFAIRTRRFAPLPLHARLADSEMVPAARPAASEPKPMTRWIGDDGTATARRSVDGGLLGVTRGGAVDAEAEDARLSPSVVVVASGAAFGLDAGAGVGLGPGALNGVAVGFSFSDDAVPGAVRARWAAAAAATGAASRVFPPLMSKSAAARSGPREPRPSTPLSAAPVRATPRTVLARRATTLARSDILSIQSRERSRGRRNVVPIEESTWPKQMKTTGWEQKLVSPVSGQYNRAVADLH